MVHLCILDYIEYMVHLCILDYIEYMVHLCILDYIAYMVHLYILGSEYMVHLCILVCTLITRWGNFIRIGITALYLKSCRCQLWI
jgi:hypothetical protein